MSNDTLHCDGCGEQIHVEQQSLVGLVMTCGCDEAFSIKTAAALPGAWSA